MQELDAGSVCRICVQGFIVGSVCRGLCGGHVCRDLCAGVRCRACVQEEEGNSPITLTRASLLRVGPPVLILT